MEAMIFLCRGLDCIERLQSHYLDLEFVETPAFLAAVDYLYRLTVLAVHADSSTIHPAV